MTVDTMLPRLRRNDRQNGCLEAERTHIQFGEFGFVCGE